MTVTDYPDFATSQDRANRIAATGVPLLTGAINLINDQAHVIPHSSVVTLPTVSVTQIGYEIALKVLSNAGSTSPAVSFDLVWTDAGTGITVGHETWNVIGGSTSGGATFYGTGPTKANRLTVSITCQDTVNSATVTTVLNQNSRIYQDDDWRLESFNTPPGFTVPARDQQGLMLANFSASIGNGGNAQRLLPLYAGIAYVYSRNSSAAQAGAIFIRNVGDPAVVASNLYQNTIAASGKATIDLVALPRATCLVEIDNNGSAASNFEFMIHIQSNRQ